MFQCKVCSEVFPDSSSLQSHRPVWDVSEVEKCCICCADVGPHICTGLGSDGLEHNFCAKLNRHLPHPRFCQKCSIKRELEVDSLIAISNRIEDLQEQIGVLQAIRKAMVKEYDQASPHVRRLKMFCGHGLPKDHCKTCEGMWKNFEVKRKAAEEAHEVKPLKRRDKAIYIKITL